MDWRASSQGLPQCGISIPLMTASGQFLPRHLMERAAALAHKAAAPAVRRRGSYGAISDEGAHSATIVISTSLRRLMPFQEGARAVDGAGLQVRRLLPGKHRDLGIGCERG